MFTVLRGLRAASIGLIAASAGTILAMALAGSTVLGGFQIPVNLIAVALFLLSLLLLRKFRLNPIPGHGGERRRRGCDLLYSLVMAPLPVSSLLSNWQRSFSMAFFSMRLT